MPVLSSIFFIAALGFAITIGPQTRPWTWGPAMLCLAVAVVFSIPRLARGKARPSPLMLVIMIGAAIAWFACRAAISPVAEAGRADLLLIACAVGAFVVIRSIDGHAPALRVLHWGVAALLMANLVVMGIQWKDPSFIPLFHSKPAVGSMTGFFSHYIEAANFLVAVSFWIASAAVWGPHRPASRVLFAVVAVAGLAGVVFTDGRGGIIGATVAGVAFASILLIQGKRRRAKWFAPAMITVPLLAGALATYLIIGWQRAQESRGMTGINSSNTIESVLDNHTRLYALGIALECIALHPVTGGGARSFSWESFRYASSREYGEMAARRVEFVHNEFMQAACDYGILGAAFLAVAVGAVLLTALLHVIFMDRERPEGMIDGFHLAGVAILCGILTQASFAFVLHLAPGALLFGAAAGMTLSRHESKERSRSAGLPVLALFGIGSAALLIQSGWYGSRVTMTLWNTEYGKHRDTTPESRIDALNQALAWWPHSSFLEIRGMLHQSLAGKPGDEIFQQHAETTVADYLEGLRLNPYEPIFAVNGGNILSQLGRSAEAESLLLKAIELQGKQEPAFRARFSLAGHFYRSGLAAYDPAEPERALEAFEQAANQIEIAVNEMHRVEDDMHEVRLQIHENLGLAREMSGDRKGALESYAYATGLRDGLRARYRTGVLLGKMAVDEWFQRNPARALTLFQQAREQVFLSGYALPSGVTLSQKTEYMAYLDRTIRFLQEAKVVPEK